MITHFHPSQRILGHPHGDIPPTFAQIMTLVFLITVSFGLFFY